MRLETRPANIEGKGMVTQRDLVRNALRMRPDRIIVGEVRGGEALDMLQAMNTGHDGSMTTVHANTPRDALARLETMVLMAGFELPAKAIREQVSSAPEHHHPGGAPERRHPEDRQGHRGDRDGRGHGGDAGHLRLREAGARPGGEGRRPVPGHRRPAEVPRHDPHGGRSTSGPRSSRTGSREGRVR